MPNAQDVQIKRVEFNTNYRNTWTIILTEFEYIPNIPRAADLPPHVRKALKRWLAEAEKEKE